jgi:hypothetical protein
MEKPMRDFLSRILNDQAFRAKVEQDPVKALESIGIHVDPLDLPKVPKPVTLPSAEQIRAILVLDKDLDYLKSCFSFFSVCGWPKH